MIATLPTTVISPSVSKPRKSTRIKFTTLRPPAGSSALAKKNGASNPAGGNVTTANAIVPIPMPADGREHRVARPPRACARAALLRVADLEPPRQPAQAEQEQDHRHDFDGDLRQRQVRRGEPGERQANDEPGATDHDQRGEAVKFRLPRGADGARAADDPQQQRTPGRRGSSVPRCAASSPVESGSAAAPQALATISTSWVCRRREKSQRTARPAARVTRDVDDVEHPLAVDARQDRASRINVWRLKYKSR